MCPYGLRAVLYALSPDTSISLLLSAPTRLPCRPVDKKLNHYYLLHPIDK
ncbi:MAG: hypothetical protein NC349_09990 [Paenibacillus sp.]|nr:hypothetical protein [Paenibacillus sp.]